MRHLFYILTLVVISMALTSCSWLSAFYIINKTTEKILISYSLKQTLDSTAYALEDTILFNNLVKHRGVDDNELISESFIGEYSKSTVDGIEKYVVTIAPNTAITCGRRLPFFSYHDRDERHRVFSNVIEMAIIRPRIGDTIILKPTLLADFSRPFGKLDIALVFD